MNFVMPVFYPAAAEIFLLAMACVILLADVMCAKLRATLVPLLSQATLIISALISLLLLNFSEPVLTFSNMFVSDPLANLLKALVAAGVFLIFIYNQAYLAARNLEKTEYYVLMLLGTLGMMVLISASHFVSLYIGLELLSLSMYALTALNRDNAQSTEAAMKYFVLGALASGMLLYGMSMIYGATGTLEIGGVAQALYQGVANKNVLLLGLVFLVAGIGFKLGVVPFHMWLPDVYQGAPTAITLFIGSVPKLAAFAMAMRLLVYGLFDIAAQWQTMLIIMVVLSIAIGNLAAIAQSNIKRMLAYSTISHMGFMLLGLVSGVSEGSYDPSQAAAAYSSALYYTIAYVLMSLGAFGMILLLSRAGHEAENIEDFKGLNQRSPWFAAMMAILMFSMAGVPVFIGFWAKFLVLLSVINAGMLWLAIYAVLFSLVGAFYYLRIVKLMYFEAPTDHAPLAAGRSMRFWLSVNALAVALLGLFPQELMYQGTINLLRSLV